MKWVLQDKNFALGNFVNITPVIKWLYQQTGAPVPVYFETEYVKQCYLDSPMIELLNDRPAGEPFVSSSLICRDNSTQDFRYAFKLKTGLEYTEAWKPFVGAVNTDFEHPPYALFINGSGSEREEYVDSKNPGPDVYVSAMIKCKAKKFCTIFTGSEQDAERSRSLCLEWDHYFIGDIRESISLVQNASLIIANDTGLAHVAGCFDKPMLVLWKNTPRIRVQNSGLNTTYSYPVDWETDIETFINEHAK